MTTPARPFAAIGRPLIATLVLVALVVQAPHHAAAQTHSAFADSGTLVYADARTAGDIDPASDSEASNDIVARTIAQTLVAFDGASITRYKPVLATRWTVGGNGSVYTFYLRHGVRFHSGRCCLTAQDVQYSIARTITLNLSTAYIFGRFITHPVSQIKILDPYTIRFDLGRPQPLFLGAVASYYAGLILDAQALKAHARKGDMGHAWAQDHDAGTGPYTIQNWVHGQQVVMTRFKDYWGGWSGRHFSTVIVRSVPESSTRRELVERGAADLVDVLTPQDYDQLKRNPRVRVVVAPSTQVDYLVLTEAGPLASPLARRAISYAFPYNAYIQAAFRGYAQRAYGTLASTVLGYDPHMYHYRTDLATAKVMLTKAGVEPGTTLTFAYPSGLPNFQIAGEMLQAQLQQIGLTLKIQQLDQTALDNVFYSSMAPSKRPNIMVQRWWPDYNDPWDESVVLIASSSAGPAGANGGYYHNAQVDALLNKMKSSGGAQLVRYAAQMQQVTSRVDPPGIWLDQPAQVVVTSRNLQGLVINPLTIETYDFYGAHR